MEPRRIILVNVPRFLREVLERAFAKVPGLRIVSEIDDLARLPAVIEQTGAQWVIVSLPPGSKMSNLANLLLETHPAVRLVNVVTDGSHVEMRWVELHEQMLDEFSMSDLIALLQSERQSESQIVAKMDLTAERAARNSAEANGA
jgi:hypothetical protein